MEHITEYEELKSTGASDSLIASLRNTGATHAAIMLYLKGRK
jgi:hypothetical protein